MGHDQIPLPVSPDLTAPKIKKLIVKNVMNVVKSVDIQTFHLGKEKNKRQSGQQNALFFLFQFLPTFNADLTFIIFDTHLFLFLQSI